MWINMHFNDNVATQKEILSTLVPEKAKISQKITKILKILKTKQLGSWILLHLVYVFAASFFIPNTVTYITEMPRFHIFD